jgi:hypothetical protein
VLIVRERLDTRLIPLDRRPHVGQSIRNWNGDPIGLEGSTLVVDTQTSPTRRMVYVSEHSGGIPFGNFHLTEHFCQSVASNRCTHDRRPDDGPGPTFNLPWQRDDDYRISSMRATRELRAGELAERACSSKPPARQPRNTQCRRWSFGTTAAAVAATDVVAWSAAQGVPPQGQIPRAGWQAGPERHLVAMNTANYDSKITDGAVISLVTGAIAPSSGRKRRRGWPIPCRRRRWPGGMRTGRVRCRGNRSDSEADPELVLSGVPRATYLPHPSDLQSPKVVWIVYQYSYARREIPLDKPSKAPIDSWMGWSTGRWEGDTLVVDVTAFNDSTCSTGWELPQRRAPRDRPTRRSAHIT